MWQRVDRTSNRRRPSLRRPRLFVRVRAGVLPSVPPPAVDPDLEWPRPSLMGVRSTHGGIVPTLEGGGSGASARQRLRPRSNGHGPARARARRLGAVWASSTRRPGKCSPTRASIDFGRVGSVERPWGAAASLGAGMIPSRDRKATSRPGIETVTDGRRAQDALEAMPARNSAVSVLSARRGLAQGRPAATAGAQRLATPRRKLEACVTRTRWPPAPSPGSTRVTACRGHRLG
jgi:hypothetical protein